MTLSAVTLKTSSPEMTKATRYFSAEEETGRVAIDTSFVKSRPTSLVKNRDAENSIARRGFLVPVLVPPPGDDAETLQEISGPLQGLDSEMFSFFVLWKFRSSSAGSSRNGQSWR